MVTFILTFKSFFLANSRFFFKSNINVLSNLSSNTFSYWYWLVNSYDDNMSRFWVGYCCLYLRFYNTTATKRTSQKIKLKNELLLRSAKNDLMVFKQLPWLFSKQVNTKVWEKVNLPANPFQRNNPLIPVTTSIGVITVLMMANIELIIPKRMAIPTESTVKSQSPNDIKSEFCIISSLTDYQRD